MDESVYASQVEPGKLRSISMRRCTVASMPIAQVLSGS
jgi:hypothetical protein